MNRFVFFVYLFLITFNAFAQTISISSFRLLESDLTANTMGTMEKDQNGEVAALIKVVTTQTGFTFDSGTMGIVKTIQKPSEIWVYVPHGIKKMTISHPQLGLLRDYYLNIPIDAARTYEMVLSTGTIQTIVKQNADGQYLVMTIEPKNSIVFIDDVEVEVTNGVVSKLLSYGKHSYRITAPLYQSDAGIIDMAKSKIERRISLKPNYGIVSISTTPENGADVYVDNEETPIGKTPMYTKKLLSGLHSFKVKKSGYNTKDVNMEVKGDGSTQSIQITMEQNFGILNVHVPENCDLYVNDEKKDINTWDGRLSEGLYYLEARRPSHHSSTMTVTVSKSKTQNIDMPDPIPILGILDVSSTPIDALVMIDGKQLGKTPNVYNDILVGPHVLTIKLNGYKDITDSIVIKESEVSKLSYQLERYTTNSENINDDKGIKTKDGGLYYGDFRNFQGRLIPYGKGITVYENGNKYEGEYVNGKRQGFGVYTFADGEKYEGEWDRDQQHGSGKYYYRDSYNHYYDGQWDHDYMHGHGVIYYANADKFEGDFSLDEREGKGCFTFADGTILIGIWHKDSCVSIESLKTNKGENVEKEQVKKYLSNVWAGTRGLINN